MKLLKQSALFFASWLLVVPAMGQTTPVESGSTIRSTATEVLLDVIVRDKRGKPVKNLKAGEVEVLEDGVRQEIRTVRFVGARDVQQQKKLPVPAGTVSRPLRATNVVCIVFHNLDPLSRHRAIEAVQEFLGNEMQPDTYFGVFNLDDRLTAVHPFTTDRAAVLKAAKSAFAVRPSDFNTASEALLTASPNRVTVTVAVDNVAHTATTGIAVTGGEVSKSSVIGADVNTGAGANALRGDQVQERTTFSNISGMRETDKIVTMLDQLGSLPGRKTVLLATTGLMTTGDPDRFEWILGKAQQSGVTVYPLDISGLKEMSSAQAGNLALGEVANVSRSQTQIARVGDAGSQSSSLAEAKQKSLQGDNMQNAVRTSDLQASLRELAEGTGGFLIANTNDYRKSFQKLYDDVQSHYEVAYRSSFDKYDGRLRKIEVKLARPELSVESRTGYFAVPDIKGAPALLPYELMGLGVLSTDPLPHAFDFRTAVFEFKDGSVSRNALALELPGTSLQARPIADRKTQFLHASILALVKNASGQIVDKFSVDAPYEIPDANLAAVQATPLTYTHPLTLPPGQYTLETAVIDREGHVPAGELASRVGRSSTSKVAFENAQPRKTVDLSSVLLVQRMEPISGAADATDPLVLRGNRIVPLLANSIPADLKPFVYFVVYPDKGSSEKPKIDVEFLVDGKTLAKQTADLPAPDPSGSIPMVVRAATHPGNCELRITALQGTGSATRSVAYNVVPK